MTATTRRAALGALATASALAIPTVAIAAVATPNADTDLTALAAEIERLCNSGEEIYAERVDPFDETFHSLMDASSTSRGTATRKMEDDSTLLRALSS